MAKVKELPEGNDELVSKGPCKKCGSSDACATYADGHTHCYSCGHKTRPAKGGGLANVVGDANGRHREGAKLSGDLLDPVAQQDPWREPKGRGLTRDTIKRFGYFAAGFKGQTVGVAPYYDMEGNLANQKLRLPNKEFVVLKAPGAGGITKCRLFGHHVFGDRFDRTVVITEGELDCMSVAQETDFKIAAVSVGGGAEGAARHCKTNYLWLDRFQEIILWFDDDAPGREAAEEVAKLFKVGKVRIARVEGCKDASDVLQRGTPGDIKTAIYMATAWRPRGIVNARDNPADVLAPREKVLCWSYPPAFENLQKMTGGIHLGEVIYHVAGTGVGKSTGLREIQHHLVEQEVKIAVLSFEDTLRDMKLGLMSIRANERLHLVEVPDPEDAKALKKYDEKMLRYHAQVFGGGLVELFDPETAEWSMEAILGYVRYCAKALDCQVIFLDPISFVAAGIDLTADERRVLDKVAGEFAKLAKELNIHLQISHHLRRTQGIPHEEGAPTSLNELRSSGGLANFAMGVIGWERNNQAAGDGWRVVQTRIIKPLRRTGKSGLADVLYYTDEGRLIKSPIPFPPIGKPKEADEDGGAGRALGFPPINDNDY